MGKVVAFSRYPLCGPDWRARICRSLESNQCTSCTSGG
jgi:hypothetical protein